ncbi:MAG: 4-hydroxy-tetrahydrodipicolinate reductase [Acidimicrobiales bacterium]|nr:4-hydroxy-tetrahydrodipicolinate reductase [Acidimicrobiales bacterium]MDG1876458.1 4-hydroxy-tetrahydrodipicolinate reductase [Acidimicrobiales bacterium]
MIRVGVVGAAGRMGQEVCRTIEDDPGTELVATIDQDDSLDLLITNGADVVVDFTVLDVARQTLAFAGENGIHAVIGTTGFSDDDFDDVRAEFTRSNALIAPNFAIGAVLMIRMAELAAPHFETAEILEFHHHNKVDAPSGTATHTAERMAAASAEWLADPTTHEVYPGARGGAGPAGIRVHSVRMVGAVANQEVILGAMGQTLTIRHDTTNRTSFMPGVLVGVKHVADFPGVTIGLDTYLGL